MSHLIVRPVVRRSHLSAAVAPVRRWLGRLVPLAVVAALGCDVDKVAPAGVDGGPSDPAPEGDASNLLTPDGDPIATECEQRFSCSCEDQRFADVESCEQYYRVEWAGIEASAAEAGLTADLACYTSWMPYATYGCDSYTEHFEEPGPSECSFCQAAYGERQVGEPCETFVGGLMSDCAQGLLCYPPADGADPVCIDPCSQAGEGESCYYLSCASGLTCDWVDMTCRVPGDEGEPCADGVCADGLLCDWQTNTCTHGAGPGESCATLACAAGLVCRWDDSTCAAPGGLGESCAGMDCAGGLFCDWTSQTCVSPGAVGESCLDRPCKDGLWCDVDTVTCAAPPGLGEPCADVCADGLLCNYGVAPAVCVALPQEGEPCVLDACAAGSYCDPDTQLCAPEPPAVCGL